MIDFGGRRVVVTGAGGGIGRVMVEVLTGLNAAVVACDAKGVPVPSGAAEARAFDLLDDGAVSAQAAEICGGGVPAAVICNAGGTDAETMDDVDEAALSDEIAFNLRAPAHLTKAFLPAMRRRKDGAAFVYISSINALAHYGNPAYSAAKAGMLGWMRAVAVEEGPNGVRANAVLPGSVRTQAWDRRVEREPDIIEKVSSLYPLGRMIKPAEVAQAAAFLASPMAGGISGAALAVDGGMSAGNMSVLRSITGAGFESWLT